MRADGQALIQDDWCPRKRKRDKRMRTQGEDADYEARREAFQGTNPVCPSLWDFQPLDPRDRTDLVFKPLGLCFLVTPAEKTRPITIQAEYTGGVRSGPAHLLVPSANTQLPHNAASHLDHLPTSHTSCYLMHFNLRKGY